KDRIDLLGMAALAQLFGLIITGFDQRCEIDVRIADIFPVARIRTGGRVYRGGGRAVGLGSKAARVFGQDVIVHGVRHRHRVGGSHDGRHAYSVVGAEQVVAGSVGVLSAVALEVVGNERLGVDIDPGSFAGRAGPDLIVLDVGVQQLIEEDRDLGVRAHTG